LRAPNEMSNTEPTKKPGMNSDAREGQAVLASYKTPAVLLIYTVKSGTIGLTTKNEGVTSILRSLEHQSAIFSC
jgi:hypothetical protein